MDEDLKDFLLPPQVIDLRTTPVGSTNNCEHQNEKQIGSDQYTFYYWCPDCGIYTQEDR